MPVPIATTHPGGKGYVQLAKNQSAETEGPFARAARLRAEAEARNAGAGPAGAAPATANGASAAPNGMEADAVARAGRDCAGAGGESAAPSIVVRGLNFSYPGLDGRPVEGVPPLITDMNLSLAPGSRCLLVGANGAGKTTLLKILGGKHMVERGAVSVLGAPPFHDTTLTTQGRLAYVGGNWTREIAFAGTSVPLTGDFPASRMIDAVPGATPERKARLMRVLDIDPDWRMHTVSDGQRRRVQICVGLLRPFDVLLLDEITVDLDVLGRADLMRFLADECEQRGATIVYATHIFDGLEAWPTHVAFVARGRLQRLAPAAELPQLREGRLLELITEWLREERERERAASGERPCEYDPAREGVVSAEFSYAFNNGWVPGTLASSVKHATNAVMRN